MSWWLWLLFGVALLVFELIASAGFFALFFAAGALIVSLLVGLGIAGPEWFHWVLFSVISFSLLFALREKLVEHFGGDGKGPGDRDSLIGQFATATDPVSAGEFGAAELRGTSWKVKNVGTVSILAGGRCRVVHVEGITLHVVRE